MEWTSILWSRWKAFAGKAGVFQSRMILALFYFLVLPPFAGITKIFSDPLGLNKKGPAKWRSKEAKQRDSVERSGRQF